jgi:hypothetical protein
MVPPRVETSGKRIEVLESAGHRFGRRHTGAGESKGGDESVRLLAGAPVALVYGRSTLPAGDHGVGVGSTGM